MFTSGFQIHTFSDEMYEGADAGLCNFSKGAAETGSEKYWQIGNRHRRALLVILFLALVLSLRCYAADVVLFRAIGNPSPEQHELELATRFYGLDLKIVPVGANESALTFNAIRPDTTVAVAIEANTFAKVNQKRLLRDLRRGSGGSVPLLILGVTAETDQTLLSEWSGIATIGVRYLNSPSGLHYVAGSDSEVTQQLTGLEFPFPGGKTYYFSLGKSSKAQVIMAVRKDHQLAPVFIEKNFHRQNIF